MYKWYRAIYLSWLVGNVYRGALWLAIRIFNINPWDFSEIKYLHPEYDTSGELKYFSACNSFWNSVYGIIPYLFTRHGISAQEVWFLHWDTSYWRVPFVVIIGTQNNVVDYPELSMMKLFFWWYLAQNLLLLGFWDLTKTILGSTRDSS